MKKVIIQITAGKGPAECCRVVALVQQMLLKEARAQGITVDVLDSIKGDNERTMFSSTLMATGKKMELFIAGWAGTVQWIAQSPYRKYHKRKNWFVGVAFFNIEKLMEWNPKDVKIETCRASGPGGQNVNKVETAVRGTHMPSGIQVFAMDSRSQLENKKLCLARLEAKVLAWQAEQLAADQQNKWLEHHLLQRGNPVRVISKPLA